MVKKPTFQYQTGFGNYFSSEAVPDTLPANQNSPQVCAHGLYAEQLSGSPFTAPRKDNLRTWMYRCQPSVVHEPFASIHQQSSPLYANEKNSAITPNQLRWHPPGGPSTPHDFVQGLHPICGSGSPLHKEGYTIHMFTASTSMEDTCFYNADGDFLIVPQQGALNIQTEMGLLHVEPQEICIIQRGMHFSVSLPEPGLARGYVLEIFESHFVLPELGPIGSNGLANPRDFQVPVAHYDSKERPVRLLHKLGGQLFQSRQASSPFNVVAWHGNYVPFKYDLRKFCVMNTVRFDHADPSIFTVLTCPSAIPGTAVADFVVFPPRWSVAEHTFRPPYFHRNVMSEFMGLICGAYEAKATFQPGGASLHLCMTPHGPDLASFQAASAVDTQAPQRLPSSTMAFMFEVNQTPRVMHSALESTLLEKDYHKIWTGFPVAAVHKRKADQTDQKASAKQAKASANGSHNVEKREIAAEAAISTG